VSGLVRSTASLIGAAAITAWILFEAPAPDLASRSAAPPLRVELAAMAQELAARQASAADADDPAQPTAAPVPVPAPDEADDAQPEAAETPDPDDAELAAAPPEAGSREGDELGEADALTEAPADDLAESTSESSSERADGEGPPADEAPSAAELASDAELLAAAHVELSGEADVGFSTVLHSEAADQLEIARAFGEEVVLVPRAALDPEAASTATWYRIAPDSLRRGRPRVEEVTGPPPTERYRRYRDLFPFEYARLPSALRELRNTSVRRSDVFVFAALIPPSEWAVVIGRRRAALDALDLNEEDVEQFVLQYVRRSGGEVDVVVDRVVTADGRSLHPPAPR